MKKAVIGLYAVVVLSIAAGLYHLVQEDRVLKPRKEVAKVEDPQVLAVLSAMEKGGEVTVPVRDIDKIIPERRDPAWRLYAASWHETASPRIAIVIDDLGLSLEATDRLATLPGPLTLAFLPYAEHLPEQTRHVRAAGHELMVHLPMEPKAKSADPGRNALLEGLPQDEFNRRIDWNLGQFKGFVGVNNHMGSLLTEDAGSMVQVMMHLKESGLLFLDSLTSPKSVGMRAAVATGVPSISRDVFLDNIQHASDIEKQLGKLERIARLRGYAIAIGHPYPVTLDTLAQWLPTLRAKGIALVPISQLVAAREDLSQHASAMPESDMGK